MIRLIIWRHARTEWNHVGRVQGQLDIDLDDIGVAQAAEAVAALTGQQVELDPRLRERDYGPWQGLTQADIRAGYPADFDRWGTAQPLRVPSIETSERLGERAGAAFRDAARRVGSAGTALVVTHGGTARAGCAAMLGWPVSHWHTLGALWNCRRTELVHTVARGWQMHAHNVP